MSDKNSQKDDLKDNVIKDKKVGTKAGDKATAEENAKMISRLSKEKKPKHISNQNVPPVNRATVKNIDLGLEGKIIPKTEELERIDIPEDASFEEKTELINQKRKKKVDDFVLKTNGRQEEQKVSSSPKPKTNDGGQKEFESFDEAPRILKDILQVKSNLFIRLGVLLFVGVFSLLITVSNDLGLSVIKSLDRKISPNAFVFVNTMLGIVAAGISYTVLAAGIKKLFKRKADCDSVAAISIAVSVIAGIVTLFNAESVRNGYYHIYICTAILGLICNTLGKLMIVKRTEENFRYVAGEFDRYAVKTVDNEDAANNFTRGSLDDFPELATMRKTEFIEDFMKVSYSPDAADIFASKAAPFILIAGAVLGLLSFVFDKNAANLGEKILVALAAFSGLLSMCCSFSLMLFVNVPFSKSSKKFLRYSGVMLGYCAVDEFADTNSVLVEAQQLFPQGMIDFVNLKVLSAASIEECILMAASLSCQAGSVLQTAFYKMLRGKTEMLYPVESYIYEDGMGLSGWIENKRVLLGNRKLMENHSIDGLPSKEKEREYAKNGNAVVYLSISGVATTLFVVQVNPSLSVSGWLQELEAEGITVVVRTIDGFLTKSLISGLFDIDKDSIKLLPFRYHKDYEAETEYQPRMSSSMVCSGHFPSFAMLIIGAKKLKYVSNLGVAVQFGMAVLGGVLSLIMMLAGTFSQVTSTVTICYNLVFVLFAMLIPKTKKI